MTEYANILDRITEGRELPEGCDAWAIRTVRPDMSSKYGYVYPFPGNWADAPGPFSKHDSECPRDVGDGICAALDWSGMASGGVPARTLLLVAYSKTDLLGKSAHKLRLSRFFVVALLDGEKVIIKAGHGANLYGADLSRANLSRADREALAVNGWTVTASGLVFKS